MQRRHVRLLVRDGEALREGFAAVRRELGVPEGFPAEVLAEAEAAMSAPRLPTADRTDLPLLTIDPPGSMDLDQAMHVQRRGRGYRVHYAIADVAAFVTPGGAIDREAHLRGLTLYAPDTRVPLHPPSLSEGVASLLPGQVAPALLWVLDLGAAGEVEAAEVRRALVRSRERYDYDTVHGLLASGRADERLLLLAEVGRAREERERERGGLTLPIPEQEVVEQDGGFALTHRAPLEVDGWNAQVSLMTGMAAAAMMIRGGIGVLRTLPPPSTEAVARLRRAAGALGVHWAEGTTYPEVVRGLDATDAAHAALLQEATGLLRGAGYTAFSSGVPEQGVHAALAAPYTHVTAPLRRLVDRYAGEVCLALCAGVEVPAWVTGALEALPGEMAAADRRAGALERECVGLVEATVLADRVGDVFDAAVVDVDARGGGGVVQLTAVAVRARYEGELALGEPVQVRLAEADPARRAVRFTPA